jgi:hypothetical protein
MVDRRENAGFMGAPEDNAVKVADIAVRRVFSELDSDDEDTGLDAWS